jgi:hypothetical protein
MWCYVIKRPMQQSLPISQLMRRIRSDRIGFEDVGSC